MTTDRERSTNALVANIVSALAILFIAGSIGFVLGSQAQDQDSVVESTVQPTSTTSLIPPIRDEKTFAVYCGIQQVRGYSASFILTSGEAFPVYALDALGLGVQDLMVNEIYEFTIRHDNFQMYLVRIDTGPADDQPNLKPCPIE